MKPTRSLFLLLFLFFQSSSFLFAQSTHTYLKNAERAFAGGDYYEASVNYKKVVAADSSKLEYVYKYAEALRLNNDYRVAEHYYKFIMDKDRAQPMLYPQASFWLATMKKYNGKYPEAKKLFKAYASKHKAETDFFAQKAKYEMTAIDAVINMNKTPEKIQVSHMDTSVNSIYNDFAPFQLGDSIFYFSSIRTLYNVKDKNGKDDGTAYLSKLYRNIRRGDSLWENTKELTPMFNAAGVHNANCVFSTDGRRFFFTRAKATSAGDAQSEIWVSELRGKWQPPVRLPDPVNATGFTTTNPSLASNGRKGDFLFFASDRPGGKGKFDIWVCTVSPDGKYSQPTNLGDKINSVDNEVTPYFETASQTLFFSSEWHKSMGGFDIFKSTKDPAQGWTEPKNMGYPVNTSYNDLYFTITSNTKDGYFVSNRPGTITVKGETCCNDIYFFEFEEVKAKLDSIKKSIEAAKEAAKELDKMTPITLFFDNDAPDPGTQDTTTALTYETTLRDYVSLRKDFENEYSKGLSGKQKDNAVKEIGDLFDNYITIGMTKLEKFSSLIETNLVNGRSVQLKVKGFTSPLAMDDYNVALAKRRVKSLINYLREYNHSIFEKYLNGTAENGARLSITEEAIGEAQASKTVSDNPNDQKGAVYSRASSLERKITITDVIITEPKKKAKS